MDGLQFFDRRQSYAVARKTLPHWSQTATLCFLTWRTADSLPTAARRNLLAERQSLLTQFGLDARLADSRRESATSPILSENWTAIASKFTQLPYAQRARLHWLLFEMKDDYLDRGAGECVLAKPELSQIVADSLLAFDGERYVVTDYVVMPNHVHVLVGFAREDLLVTQPASWKRFTAGRINRALGRTGRFWQIEQFDHLVRSEEEFQKLRRYIAENPKKAKLAAGSYRHYSKPLEQTRSTLGES